MLYAREMNLAVSVDTAGLMPSIINQIHCDINITPPALWAENLKPCLS
jgi:hypothetical protein